MATAVAEDLYHQCVFCQVVLLIGIVSLTAMVCMLVAA